MSDQLPYSERYRLIKLGLLPKEAVKKQPKPIAKKSLKKIAEEKEERASRGTDGETQLTKWFKLQMRMMPEYCEETGLKLETKIYKYAIMSICHILPKATCKSVALHPLNRMFFNVDFHQKFDAMSWEEREQLGCWKEIRERLIMMYDQIDQSELRHFPSSVREYIEENEPF